MSKTTLQKLAAIIAFGVIFGLIYTIYMMVMVGLTNEPMSYKPVLFGLSVFGLLFGLVPWVVFVILAFVSVLLTQDDRISLVFHGFFRWMEIYVDNEAFPGYRAAGIILVTVFYGTFIGLTWALSLVSASLNHLFMGVLIFSDIYYDFFEMALLILVMLVFTELCELGVFYFAYERNRISEKSNIFLIYFLKPLVIVLFTVGLSFMIAFPPGNGAMAIGDAGQRLLVSLVTVVGAFPAELVIFKLVGHFPEGLKNTLRLRSINTTIAAVNAGIFLIVMAFPPILFVILHVGSGAGLVSFSDLAEPDRIIGTWQSDSISGQSEYVDTYPDISVTYSGNDYTMASYGDETFTFTPDGYYVLKKGDSTMRGFWVARDSAYYLDGNSHNYMTIGRDGKLGRLFNNDKLYVTYYKI